MLFALWWWLVAQAVALCATPLCLALFRPLADRGYALSKAFGLLLFGYVAWLLVHVLPNGLFSLLLALALVAAGSYAAWRRDAAELRTFWRRRRRLLLLEEALFLIAYLGFALIRSYNADIAGTEKPMDFAFMNAVTRSTHFPPLDPWLAPSPSIPNPTINYYYFGYLIQGLLLELTRVPPAVGFNLALSLIFGLSAAGIFSLGYTLARDITAETPVARSRRPQTRGPVRPAQREQREAGGAWSFAVAWPLVAAGLLAVYMLLIAGNLWTALRRFDNSGLWQKGFWDGIGWNATRVLVIKRGDADVDYTINEFPSFSFLLGDLHPHVLALPFVIMAVGLAYTWLMRPPRLYRWAVAGEPLYEIGARGKGQGTGGGVETEPAEPALAQPENAARAPARAPMPRRGWRARWERAGPFAEVIPGALVLGSLYFLNSWDFPAYFFLAQAAALAGAWWVWQRTAAGGRWPAAGDEHRVERESEVEPDEAGEAEAREAGPSWMRAAGVALLTAVLAVALFLPFHLSFKPPVVAEGGGLPLGVVAQRSHLRQFLEFWGAQLLVLTPTLVAALGGLPLARGSLAGSLAEARAAGIVARETAGSNPALLLSAGALAVLVAERVGAGALALCALLAAAAGWGARRALEQGLGRHSGVSGVSGGGRPLAFALGAICLAALLLAACEVVHIRDFYGGSMRRMNTVFKFYYQAWLLFAAGGSAATYWLLRRLWRRRGPPAGRLAFGAVAGLCALLFYATLLFPYKVTLLRTNSFQNVATLDGMDWMRRLHPDDYAAAQWLREHGAAAGGRAPVILEATGGAYSEFARLATQTGFPTVLGWDQHERLWRGAAINPEIEARQRDVDAIYSAGMPGAPATLAQARPLLDKYTVAYVALGYLELQKYGGSTPAEQQQYAARFDSAARAAGWQTVFHQGQTTIYSLAR